VIVPTVAVNMFANEQVLLLHTIRL